MRTVMGGETEYAISARDARGQIVHQSVLLDSILNHARRHLGYTSQSSRGRFLSNGGLLYLDAGLHLEWATPESTSPFEVVRYLQAGDRIVYDLAMSFLNASPNISAIFCSRANVDYLSGTLWAGHESYMHNVPPAELAAQLIPFLASRVLLGAGGWDRGSPGLRFTTSPRAHFITRQTDRDSQHVRPIFHTKDEPLGQGSHRLHVACSESLCSETANVLRFGTTAIVLALLERGIRPANPVTLVNPVRAMQRFALNPRWRACVIGEPRRWVSALDIQRHYLGYVEAYFDGLELPDWAARVCRMWRTLLDDLEDPSRVDRTLDWAIKQRLFQRQLDRHGIAWSSLPAWNRALEKLRLAWINSETTGRFEIGCVLGEGPRIAGERTRQARFLASRGLDLAQLADLDTARHEMFELDAKFGALGDAGLFNALDAAGALHHRVGGLDVESALTRPPQDTRARVRGAVVKRLSEAGIPYAAEWTSVHDYQGQTWLNLHDPFETEERWSPSPVI
jgi:proteasome accessory factor A